MPKQWAPSRILSAGLIAGLGLLLMAIYLASSLPYLGIRTAPGQDGVLVTSVSASSPLAGIVAAGDELLAIGNRHGEFRLEPPDGMREPDDSSHFDAYNRFFERQARIWPLLETERLSLRVQRGGSPALLEYEPEWVTITVAPATHPSELPAIFWYQVICGLLIFWMGIAAWAFAQHERGPFFYALAGFAMAVAITTSAVYTTRALALPADLFLALSRVNQLGAMLFAGAGTTLLWYYPTRISSFRFEWLMVLLVGLILAANWGQWMSSLDFIARVTLLGWATADIVLAVVQWRRTRCEPVARARLKWFVYAWFSGVIAYMSLVVAPQLIGLPSVLHQQYAWGFFVLTYLGIALGIVRYRLFDLDRWILMAWFWFACGILILLFDGIFLVWLNLQQDLSLVMSLVVVGWIYFPLRQLLLSKLQPSSRRKDLWNQLSSMISHAFDAHHNPDQQWQEALQTSFAPLKLSKSRTPASHAEIVNDGLRLRVPMLDQQSSLVLSYANQGHRLFDREDLQFTTQALDLFRYAQHYRDSFRQGVQTERKRVARDLHDDVGARLLSIVYRTQDSDLRNLARESLHELRDVIQGLQKQTVHLDVSFERWRNEARKRCELFGVDLDMTLSPEAATMDFTSRADRNLTSIIREILSNSLRHAQASHIELRLHREEDQLVLMARDDGIGWPRDMTETSMGIGIHSISERCAELHGSMALFCPIQGGAGICCLIPESAEEAK